MGRVTCGPHNMNKTKHTTTHRCHGAACARPSARTHTPLHLDKVPMDKPIDTYAAAALSIWRREEAGMGHTRCDKPLPLILRIKNNA